MTSVNKVELEVEMTCEGCAKVVRNVLSKVEGVQDVSIDVASKRVVVTGTAGADAILTTVKKTGKKCSVIA